MYKIKFSPKVYIFLYSQPPPPPLLMRGSFVTDFRPGKEFKGKRKKRERREGKRKRKDGKRKWREGKKRGK